MLDINHIVLIHQFVNHQKAAYLKVEFQHLAAQFLVLQRLKACLQLGHQTHQRQNKVRNTFQNNAAVAFTLILQKFLVAAFEKALKFFVEKLCSALHSKEVLLIK